MAARNDADLPKVLARQLQGGLHITCIIGLDQKLWPHAGIAGVKAGCEHSLVEAGIAASPDAAPARGTFHACRSR